MAGTTVGLQPDVVFVAPIVPAPTGNGLAMRAGMLLEALAPVAAVHLVVVPVSGAPADRSWAAERARSITVVQPVAPDAARDHVTMQLADAELRARLEQTAPLPARAALAPPTLAGTVEAALPRNARRPAAMLAMRLYLAPLGIHLAHHLGAPRVVVDADDDDGTLLRALGELDEADAFDRLAKCWLREADAVTAASATDAASIAVLAGIEAVDIVPNTMSLPAIEPPPAPGTQRLLFVGNLTYEPNRLAARELAERILPRVRLEHPSAMLDLVGGTNDGSLDDLASIEGICLSGAVPDVAPHYATADVVVVPLRHGAGTRIKILEAFAHRRPVVATPAAVAGLDLSDGHEAVIAESPDEIARAVVALLDDPDRAATIVDRAAALVATRYGPDVIAPLVRVAVLGSPA